jgi:putative transposase
VVVAGEPHHVTQRGNNRQPVFSNDRDRVRYLRFLRQECGRHGVRIIGFCLMPNHIHLVVIPERIDSLAKAVGRAHYAYTFSCRTAYGNTGHLWQNRYYSTPLDPGHLVAALAYVDLNPVRASIVSEPEDFIWSSARAHLSQRDTHGILDMNWWRESGLASDWKQHLRLGVADEVTAELRHATQTGKPRWKVPADGQG